MLKNLSIHAKVHKPLVRLLRSCVEPDLSSDEGDEAGWGTNNSNYEEPVVELMCHLCARIKTYPELLLVFIHNRSRSSQLQAAEADPGTTLSPAFPMNSDFSAAGYTSNSPTQTTLNSSFSSSSHHLYNEASKESDSKLAAIGNALKGDSDMLIFSYLLRFLHREGRVGDLARVGLLFLMELAMGRCSIYRETHLNIHLTVIKPHQPIRSPWLLVNGYSTSDFADVLGASLGAADGYFPANWSQPLVTLAVRTQLGEWSWVAWAFISRKD
ncbi:hypothetical protein Pst134EA_007377 [Puccinia striiformis f. sp. tritici]|uniref:hypothetical protein n=1 Tax=Puccinia striiformis f. sp. tritici TaxID=168172 RepID=UPI00200849BB|nr:hypothetical protein Pst134EA_007377 [Puccinia striiformis f. sp. tritici]KAH9470112.1 hypothetical protein Pst134EA_007377 [Puccinia striiformis f. sp. tritici]